MNTLLINRKPVKVTFKVETCEEGTEKPKELEICTECLINLLMGWGKQLERGLSDLNWVTEYLGNIGKPIDESKLKLIGTVHQEWDDTGLLINKFEWTDEESKENKDEQS